MKLKEHWRKLYNWSHTLYFLEFSNPIWLFLFGLTTDWKHLAMVRYGGQCSFSLVYFYSFSNSFWFCLFIYLLLDSFLPVTFSTFLVQWIVCLLSSLPPTQPPSSIFSSSVVVPATICFCSIRMLPGCRSQLAASISFSMDPLATSIVSCCWFLFSCCFLWLRLYFWQSLSCLDYCLENYWFPADVITNSQQMFW